MLKLKTILAPVDFSIRTEPEAQNAAEIATKFGSRLILLHVIPRFADAHPTDPAAVEAYAHEFTAEVERGVDTALQALAERVAPGLDVERVVMTGNPAEKIDEVAVARQADMVVMPTRGRGRIRRHLIGSVTNRVIHDLSCPVLTGAHEGEPSTGTSYKRIACQICPQEDGEKTLGWARDFAAAYGAEIVVYCILPFYDELGDTASLPEPLREQARSKARDQMEALTTHVGIEAEIVVMGGAVEEVLPAFVKNKNIDLIIRTRRRLKDVMGLLGQHTDIIDTVKSAPCPMILL